jgi:hypothetical protein
MRYKHETFTKMILKDGFISFLFNNIGALYLSYGTGWNYQLPCTGRKTLEPCSCTRPCASKNLNSVNATRISNTLQKTAFLYLIYFTRYVSAMFHSNGSRAVMSFMFHTLCMYRRQAMERTVAMTSFFSPYHHRVVKVLCVRLWCFIYELAVLNSAKISLSCTTKFLVTPTTTVIRFTKPAITGFSRKK